MQVPQEQPWFQLFIYFEEVKLRTEDQTIPGGQFHNQRVRKNIKVTKIACDRTYKQL